VRLRAGILMPHYACSLSAVPVPAEPASARRILSRMAAALDAVHAAGWLHGDVKPGNIFLDSAGEPWLGDYGSSCPYGQLAEFTGGTPAYQLEGLDAMAAPVQFDRAGLAVTLLCLLGLLQLRYAPAAGWPAAAAQAAVARVEDEALRTALEGLLGGSPS
jgi:serine/threonine-protein kinase